MKILLIYNPQAGHQRAKKLLNQVESYFKQKEIEFELFLTDYPRHATEFIAKSDFSQFDGIIAAGGDGTLFEVINGYFQNSLKKRIPVGVLPVGTGNAFARDLNIESSQWKEAIDIISLNKPKKVDVGKYITENKTYYFLNILGLGFVADVGETARHLKLLGNISYTIGVLYRTLLLNTHQLTIEIDGQTYERENIFVEISNSKYTADFLMAPNAENDDGYLDITLLGKITRTKLLKFFPKVFTGEHIHFEEIETFKAKKINVTTIPQKILTPDGELFGKTPIEVECLHQAVEVFWK